MKRKKERKERGHERVRESDWKRQIDRQIDK